MNVLFLTKELPYPMVNGYRMRTFHYLSALCGDNSVSVVWPKSGAEDAVDIAAVERLGCRVHQVPVCRFPRLVKLAGAIFRSLFTGLPFSVAYRFSPSLYNYMRKTLRDGVYDLLVCDGIHMAPHVVFDSKARSILDEHNIESTIIARYAQIEKNFLLRIPAWLEERRFMRFENRTWARFNECHVCSEVDRQTVVRRSLQSSVFVIPNGVSVSPPDSMNTEDAILNARTCIIEKCVAASPMNHGIMRTGGCTGKTAARTDSHLSDLESGRCGGMDSYPSLAYTGMMGWKPNVDAVLYFCKEILPVVRHTYPNLVFRIVGKQPTPSIRLLGKKDPRIIVTGFVHDVRTCLSACDAVVVPLRIGSGTRLKILEAMALGKPVVSTTVGAEGLNIRNMKNIVLADDPHEFAEKVVPLLSDPVLARAIGRAGRALVESEYTWSSVEDRIARRIEAGIESYDGGLA